jgi:hypothetical protein
VLEPLVPVADDDSACEVPVERALLPIEPELGADSPVRAALVPSRDVLLPLAVAELAEAGAALAFLRMKWSASDALAVLLADVALPLVPVGDGSPAGCRQPVTVSICSVRLWAVVLGLCGEVEPDCAATPTLRAAARTDPKITFRFIPYLPFRRTPEPSRLVLPACPCARTGPEARAGNARMSRCSAARMEDLGFEAVGRNLENW